MRVAARAPSRRARRDGFSLIELLINIAIIASLVATCIPLYTDYILQAMRAKADADLDVIVSAITRCEALESRVTGTSLDPLLGRYLQILPLDPWGNDFLFDGYLCVIASFGADGQPYGSDDDDVFRQYNRFLTPNRVFFKGGFGIPKLGNRLTILTSKPFRVLGMVGDPADEVELVKGFGDSYPLSSLGYRINFAETSGLNCRLVLSCDQPGDNVLRVTVSGADLVNFSPGMLSITDFPSPGSQMITIADDFRYGPVPCESTGGIPIEME